MTEALVSTGGFCAPRLPYHPAHEIERAFLIHGLLPVLSTVRGGIDFSPPHVRWARARERELRAGRKQWDWPPVPEVAR